MGNLVLAAFGDMEPGEKIAVDPFADFWCLYPRHEAKRDAMKAWSSLTPAEQTAATIAAADWRAVWRAQGREQHHIPLPATWLRGARWEDELPAGTGPQHASHVPVAPAKAFERGEMPDYVKALLAKMRK